MFIAEPVHRAIGLQVVLGDAVLDDEGAHIARTRQVLRRECLGVEQILQLRRLTRIEINALGIQHKEPGIGRRLGGSVEEQWLLRLW